jgi:hypothetical protein
LWTVHPQTQHEQELSQLRSQLEAKDDLVAGIRQELTATTDALSAAEQVSSGR